MAHKKGGASSSYGRDSISKRLGVKKYGGEQVRAGAILVRNVGLVYCRERTLGWVKIILSLP